MGRTFNLTGDPHPPATVMGVEVKELREMIKCRLMSCLSDRFFYYDRKEDEELGVDLLRAALETRTVTLEDMLEWAGEAFMNAKVQSAWGED